MLDKRSVQKGVVDIDYPGPDLNRSRHSCNANANL